jgi:hypothetical protein
MKQPNQRRMKMSIVPGGICISSVHIVKNA